MNLKHLTDKSLLKDLKNLVQFERDHLIIILHHLKEVDRRKLYSDLGYPSLYAYCLKDLGYSEGSAQRRIQACRMMREMPEIEKKLESGALNLSNVSKAVQFFNQFSVEKPEEKRMILEKVENSSTREAEKALFELSGVEKPAVEKTQRVCKDKVRLTIVLEDATIEKLRIIRCLFGKNMSHQELIDTMADLVIKDLEKKKFKKGISPLPPAPAVIKSITSATKRAVFERDKKCVKCGGLWNLNFDHRIPKALGGNSSQENIRLLCFNCNQRSRIRARL